MQWNPNTVWHQKRPTPLSVHAESSFACCPSGHWSQEWYGLPGSWDAALEFALAHIPGTGLFGSYGHSAVPEKPWEYTKAFSKAANLHNPKGSGQSFIVPNGISIYFITKGNVVSTGCWRAAVSCAWQSRRSRGRNNYQFKSWLCYKWC